MVQCSNEPSGSRADRRRRHLLDTARTLFVANGFHQTGIAQIAAASGIAVGQIYRDFDGKDAIIAAICEMDVAAWLEEDVLCAAVQARDTGAIRAWILRFGAVKESRDQCRMMAEIVAESARNERIAQTHRTVDAKIRASLTAALAALAVGKGGGGDVDMLVELILATGMGMATRRAIHPEVPAMRLDRYVAGVVDRELARLTD